jgi:hypothetical protein
MASEEQLNSASKLKQELDDILFLQRSFTDEALKAAKAVFGTSENARKAKQAFRGVSNATQEVANTLKEAIDGTKSMDALQKTIDRQTSSVATILGELSQLNSDRIDLGEKDLSLLERKERIYDILKDQSNGLTDDEEYLLGLYADQLETLEEQEKIKNQLASVQEKMGILPSLGSGIEGLLKNFGAGGLADKLGFKEARIEAESFALKSGDGANKFNVAGKYITTLGKNLLKSLGPLTLITAFLKGLLQANTETVKLQKSFLLTSEQAVDLRQDMSAVANTTGNINITATKLLGTISSINDQFGFVARFSDETLVNTTRLTEQVGLAAESANALAGLTEIQGANAEELYENTVGTSLELAKQTGIQITAEKLFSEIAKTTGTVRANLGSNPIEIAKAIQKAQEFGASLEQVASAGESLLNFEQSIEAELQAELLLGKNINLERARAAALAGDQVTLAEELKQQAGSFAEFSSMNVIQQKALADAMGMSKDELADTLYQQELQLKGAEQVRAELAATGQDEAVRALDAQTAQDKFNKTMEKLQAIVVDVATAFMPILEVVGSIASAIGQVIKLLDPMIGTISGALTGLIVSGGNPIGALIGGAVGAIGDISRADDAIIPAGYGETIIKKGKDTIALNNEDSVVAGTNLGGSNNEETKRTNMLLEKLITQNKEKPQISPVGLYQVQ